MVRTQIQLTSEQHRRVRELAVARGVSMATIVREGVQHVIARRAGTDRWELFMSAVGACRARGGARDVARRHDAYLSEAYAGRRRLR
ncbi:MAG: CopG family transcriptional regulator [bacterium]